MRTTRYGSGGPPLVLVHGLACDGSDWAAQVVAFEPRTTVIVCELPGQPAVHPKLLRVDAWPMLIANLAGWDAGEVEVALDCIAVPLLAIQTTTMDTARQRASLQPGESSPWLDLIRAHVPHAAITTLFGSGHFPQIERSQEITELIACFAQL